MTPSLALAATITGTLLTLAPLNPGAVREAHQSIDPDAELWMDPDVAAQLDRLANADRTIARNTRYLTAIDWRYDQQTRNQHAWLDGARQIRREIEDWLTAAYDMPARPVEPEVEQFTCDACSATGDPDDFRAYEAGECDDEICDECLAVHRDAAAADESNRLAYYYR